MLFLSGKTLVLFQQLFPGFRVLRIKWNAIDRANLHTLRSFEMPDALGTQKRIDFIELLAR